MRFIHKAVTKLIYNLNRIQDVRFGAIHIYYGGAYGAQT